MGIRSGAGLSLDVPTRSNSTYKMLGSKYPTSNVYFTQAWRIELLLKKYVTCDDEDIKQMAMEMQIKFDKYWEDYKLILAIGAVLDPRLKVQMLELAYKKVDPTTSDLKIGKLGITSEMIFKAYQTSSISVSGTTNAHDLVNLHLRTISIM
ncbi:unnamed protein product [Arabidopsis thaliana]|uniref:(thale cress) hypothetical protein n=1 Tax=Arabidopsis thaliana TaxID=3702 RepID=A0A7G2DZD8_ARATH|nr:unnamed protein product [Arabidopsis thaliana]